MAKGQAYGRVGLLGNPSDMYGGKCISFTFDRKAEVEVQDADAFAIHGNGGIERILDYNGKHDLFKASLRILGLEKRIQKKPINLFYESNIPVGYGFAGSSALVIATLRALNEHYSLSLKREEIAEIALHAELDELGIAAGFQDRYVISFEGLLFMDFVGKEYMHKEDPYGYVSHLPFQYLPCFVGYGGLPKTSASVHNPLREHFLKGHKEVKIHMDKIAELAEQGVSCLLQRDWNAFGKLMNENTSLRDAVIPPLKNDSEMIVKALSFGALGAKVLGSGGAVVVLADDDSVFDNMSKMYKCFWPKIVP